MVGRIRKSKDNTTAKKKWTEGTKIDLQNTTQTTKDQATRTPLNPEVIIIFSLGIFSFYFYYR